jgi:hypothetical protein
MPGQQTRRRCHRRESRARTGHVAAALGTAHKIGLDRILGPNGNRCRDLALALLVGRILDPISKLAAARALSAETAKQRFHLDHVVLVGDRGMITQARITDDIKSAGLDWITALGAPAIKALLESGTLQLSLFDQRDIASITPMSGWWSAATPISPPSAPASARTSSLPPSAVSPASRRLSPADAIRCAAPPRSRSRSVR